MTLVLADRVKETTTTTGTGTVDLSGAVTGFQGFVAGIGNGNSCYYCIAGGSEWETGIGTVTDAATDTLSRTTVIASSNAGSLVSFSAGSKDVFCTLPAPRTITTDLRRFVGALAYHSTTQSLATSGSNQALLFDSEEFDTDAFHSTSSDTSKFTVPTGLGGKYAIIAQVDFAANATGIRRGFIRLNGSTTLGIVTIQTVTQVGITTTIPVHRVYSLSAGDYVELVARQDSGGALNAQGGAGSCFLSLHYLG
jgi:hypothetical protein